MNEYELQAQYDARKSFYGKARVTTHLNEKSEMVISLYSYETLVCYIVNKKPVVLGTYSQTTLSHIKEFLIQHGFIAETKAQIEKDYKKVN